MDKGQAANVEPVCVRVTWQAVVGMQGGFRVGPDGRESRACLCALVFGAAPGANLGTPGMRDRTRSTRPENAARRARARQSRYRSERRRVQSRSRRNDRHAVKQARTPVHTIHRTKLTFLLLGGDYGSAAALVAAREARDPAR